MGRTYIRPRTPLEFAEFCARHDCPKNAGALFAALSADGRIHCGRKASASSPPRITEITVGSLARLRLYRHTSHSATGRLGGSFGATGMSRRHPGDVSEGRGGQTATRTAAPPWKRCAVRRARRRRPGRRVDLSRPDRAGWRDPRRRRGWPRRRPRGRGPPMRLIHNVFPEGA